MKLGVINVASQTATNTLRAYLSKSSQAFSKIYLLDLFPNYAAHQVVNNYLDTVEDVRRYEVEKVFQKYFLRKTTDECDVLLYFTHNYYMNASCKNEHMLNVSDVFSNSQNQKVIFVNLAEKAQTSEGREYFNKAVSTEAKIGQQLGNASFIWTNLIGGTPTEFTDFLKLESPLYQTGKQYSFNHVDSVVDAIANAQNGKLKSQFNQLEPDQVKSDTDLAKLGGSKSMLNIKENIVSQMLVDDAKRQNSRLWDEPTNISSVLPNYETIKRSGSDKTVDIDFAVTTSQQDFIMRALAK